MQRHGRLAWRGLATDPSERSRGCFVGLLSVIATPTHDNDSQEPSVCVPQVGIDLERERSVCVPAFERTNLHTQLVSTELGGGLTWKT